MRGLDLGGYGQRRTGSAFPLCRKRSDRGLTSAGLVAYTNDNNMTLLLTIPGSTRTRARSAGGVVPVCACTAAPCGAGKSARPESQSFSFLMPMPQNAKDSDPDEDREEVTPEKARKGGAFVGFLRLVSRLMTSFFCAVVASLLMGRIAGDTIFTILDYIPLHAGEFLFRVFSPDTVIDGETAYDVRMLDELLLLCVPLWICFFILFRSQKS